MIGIRTHLIVVGNTCVNRGIRHGARIFAEDGVELVVIV
jgi:hypothetical protein